MKKLVLVWLLSPATLIELFVFVSFGFVVEPVESVPVVAPDPEPDPEPEPEPEPLPELDPELDDDSETKALMFPVAYNVKVYGDFEVTAHFTTLASLEINVLST